MLVFNLPPQADALAYKEIIAFAETCAVTSRVGREYIVRQLLEDENVLSRICEEADAVGDSLRAAALQDIEAVMAPYQAPDAILDAYTPSIRRSLYFAQYQQSLETIMALDDPAAILDGIIAHYRAFGGGAVAQHVAFRWDEGLHGIEVPDTITLDQLYCLDTQKREIIENTEAFLAGKPANNVILYGNSGCGKSSMVKAILNRYHAEGLRLVQIQKENLPQLPQLIRQIQAKPFRYIIFMDDLSFEIDDLGYKTLKTILDGSIEKQPGNILFYATSNRLHLISETWAERKANDVHFSDTQNEKMSLAERFGIRVSFLSPGQREYLEIIEGILQSRGIPVTEELRAEAVKWAWQCNGLSGRTAMQFVTAILPKVGQ